MNEMELLMELHRTNSRLGPGSDEATLRALELTGLDPSRPLNVADIGCGTGAQTITLAKVLHGKITAVDIFPEFLKELERRCSALQLISTVDMLDASMDELPFLPESLDLIWSEGAVYNMGFSEGISYWHRFLRLHGVLAVTEITWLTDHRPATLQRFWADVYPQMDTVGGKIQILESAGYEMLGHFTLSRDCWTKNYYQPLRASHKTFLERFPNNKTAGDIVKHDLEEMSLYEQFSDLYGYVFYVARKVR